MKNITVLSSCWSWFNLATCAHKAIPKFKTCPQIIMKNNNKNDNNNDNKHVKAKGG